MKVQVEVAVAQADYILTNTTLFDLKTGIRFKTG